MKPTDIKGARSHLSHSTPCRAVVPRRPDLSPFGSPSAENIWAVRQHRPTSSEGRTHVVLPLGVCALAAVLFIGCTSHHVDINLPPVRRQETTNNLPPRWPSASTNGRAVVPRRPDLSPFGSPSVENIWAAPARGNRPTSSGTRSGQFSVLSYPTLRASASPRCKSGFMITNIFPGFSAENPASDPATSKP